MTARDMRSPRLWLGLMAGTALALGSATAMAGDMGASMKSETMKPETMMRAADTAPAGTHTSLKELQTAQVHTGYAADAKTLKDAKTHLHHAANCLVGPNNPGFSATYMDPCKGEGAGAIADSTNPQRIALAKDALAQINSGLQSKNLSVAQNAAKQATDTLRMAVKGAPGAGTRTPQ